MTDRTLTDRVSEELSLRVLTCMPAATFGMETLLRLTRLQASLEVPTAAIECQTRPRLLVNPAFVNAYCKRDEHLFLLVMHELWHVLLAHTRLYPRATLEQNIAFDAVINAGLSRELPSPEYRGFFEAVNPSDRFPGLLLRPPEGWPESPVYPVAGPKGTRTLLARLYPPSNDLVSVAMPLYEEILDLLHRARKSIPMGDLREIQDGAGGQEGNAGSEGQDGQQSEAVLIGDHQNTDREQRSLDDSLFGDVVRRLVASWPPPPFPLAGRDAGAQLRDWSRALSPAPGDVRRAFARVLRLTLGPLPDSPIRNRQVVVRDVAGIGVLPNGSDRLAPARRALGVASTLWQQTAPVSVRQPDVPPMAHVYLDVSGSMTELIPYLTSLLLPYAAAGRARVFQFSTQVEPLPLESLRRGDVKTTGGTDIECVLDHILAEPRLRRVLLLTDGYTGQPRPDQAELLLGRKVRLHVVLPSESAWTSDLAGIATSTTELPPLRPQGQPWRIGA
jgi:hypothetical protein